MDVVKPKANKTGKSFYWIGLPTAALILGISIFLWDELKQNEIRNVQYQIANASILIVNPIQNIIKNQIASLSRMGKRWENQGGTPEQLWYQDAEQSFLDEQAFSAIEWIDQKRIIQWIVPKELLCKMKTEVITKCEK